MIPLRRLHVIVPLLAAAGLAGCDEPTRQRAISAERAGIAPLLAAGPDALPGQYVVVMHRDDAGPAAAASLARQTVQTYGGKVRHTYGAALHGFAASLSPQAVEALRRDPRVKYVAQDGKAYPSQVTQPGATWGLDRIDQRQRPLSNSYTYSRGGRGVRVYVIDTGILTTHAEFTGRASVGADLVGDGQNGQDCDGHGTHVAGTIAGSTYGVAKGAQVISVRVFNCGGGGGAWSTIVAAVDWVTANAVKPAVANMSLGGWAFAPINEAVQASIASGVTYTVSAGNMTIDACERSPASTPEAITVGATDPADSRSDFSNYGPCVDLFAPGTDITSAWWTGTAAVNTISGTSMAAPHAAGVAALVLEGSPTATPAQVAAAMESTSTPGVLTNLGGGSPNKLLYSGQDALPPAPLVGLSADSILFTFVRTASGAAASASAAHPAQSFMAWASGPVKPEGSHDVLHVAAPAGASSSGNVTLSNLGDAPLNWTSALDSAWFSVNPTQGQLAPGGTTRLNVSATQSGRLAGERSGRIRLTDPAASNPHASLTVQMKIVDGLALVPGTDLTGLSGAAAHMRYFSVEVPEGATRLTVSIDDGTGDADLYLRYGQLPTLDKWDCRPYGGSSESCTVNAPAPGTYNIMLYGYFAYAGVTLSASLGGSPGAPPALNAAPSSLTSMRLTWADSSAAETRFDVSRRSTAASGDWSAWQHVGSPAANATTMNSTGLAAGTSYQHRVRACGALGCSVWTYSPWVQLPATPPAAPAALTATATSGTTAALAWADSATNEASFTLARSLREPDGTWGAYTTLTTGLPANATSQNNNGLLSGRQYRWQLRACNVAGCSAWATSGILTMPFVPRPPALVAGTATAATQVRVTWADSSTNETSFTVGRAPVTGGVVGTWTDLASPPANTVSYLSSGLVSGQTYRYRVRSCSLAGCSAWVATGFVTTPTVPPAPTGVAGAAMNDTLIRVTWTDASPNESSFTVSRAPVYGGVIGVWADAASLPANTTAYLHPGVNTGEMYRYRVRACNVAGCSAWVATGFVTTATIPATPTGVVVETYLPPQVRMLWNDVATNETGYVVSRATVTGGVVGPWSDVAGLAADAEGFNDTRLPSGQTYRYRVRACNVAGCSAPAASPYVTTP